LREKHKKIVVMEIKKVVPKKHNKGKEIFKFILMKVETDTMQVCVNFTALTF
jgi:hypothetical protein